MKKDIISYKGNTFYKINFCFFAITFVGILSLAIIYISNINQSNRLLKQSYDDMVEKMADNFQQQVVNHFDFMGEEILKIEELQTLMTEDTIENDTPELEALMRNLNSLNHYQNKGDDLIFLYFKKSRETVSMRGKIDSVEDRIINFLGLDHGMWEQLTEAKEETVSFFVKTERMDYGRLMFGKEICPGVIYIRGLAEKNILEILNTYYTPVGSEIFLTAMNDSYFSNIYGLEHPEHKYLTKLIEYPKDSLQYNNKPYFKYQSSFEDSSIQQMVLIPNNITSGWSKVILSICIITTLLLALGAILSYLLASKIYRPIQTLIHNLPMEEVEKDAQEFMLVDKVIKTLHQKALTFEQQVAEQNKRLADNLLLRLMKRDLTYSLDIEQALTDAGFPNGMSSYIVLFLQPEIPETNDQGIDSEMMKTICRKVFKENGYSVYVVQEADYLIVIADLSRQEKGVFDQLGEMHKILVEQCTLPVTITCSQIYRDLVELPAAYDEAHMVLENCLLVGEYGTVKNFSKQSENWQKNIYGQQLTNKVAKLIHYIQAEDYEQVKQCLKEIFEHLNEDKHQPIDFLRKQIKYILDTIALTENYKESPDNNFNQLLSQSSITANKKNMNVIYQELYDHFEQLRLGNESKQTSKTTDIVKYIKEHSNDPNLTVGMVAEHFGISISWMSNLLKRELNMSFLNCLHQERIAKAKDLIIKTDHTISDIAAMVGYANSLTMNRAFKRYEGVTPSWYRAKK